MKKLLLLFSLFVVCSGAYASEDDAIMFTVVDIYSNYTRVIEEKNKDFASEKIDPRWGDLRKFMNEELRELFDAAKLHDAGIKETDLSSPKYCLNPMWGIYGEWQDLEPSEVAYASKHGSATATFLQFKNDPSSRKTVEFKLICPLKSNSGCGGKKYCLVKDFINEHGQSLKEALKKSECGEQLRKSKEKTNPNNKELKGINKFIKGKEVINSIYEPSISAFSSKSKGDDAVLNPTVFIWGDLMANASESLQKKLEEAIAHDEVIIEKSDPSLPLPDKELCYLRTSQWSLYGKQEVVDPSTPTIKWGDSFFEVEFLANKSDERTRRYVNFYMDCNDDTCKVLDIIDSDGSSYDTFLSECITKYNSFSNGCIRK
ncbi:hypothetical protein QG464_07040 [Taylorella equigenitalis]|uniref:hypothetical protein n=1 Tax=Taylorella equigenitalis TaxID=29575 RepID=UPI0024787F31|nr:hypothetical protein [Taylorella equigenitalis]WGQ17676.1 hypothetical protein QG464_07040 [Taylorella equigenitalis]